MTTLATAAVQLLIADCDHVSIAEEAAVAAERNMRLTLRQCRTEDDVIEAGADADGIVVQYAPITERVLAALPKLKAVGRYGVGVDTIDVAAATARGVAVCNVPDYCAEDVSDHAVALAVSLARGIALLDRNMRHGQQSLTPVNPLHRFGTRTFGVVGLGLIGSATARKARGLGFTVVGYDRLRAPGTTTAEGVQVVSLDELLRVADVISLHVPLVAATRHLIDAAVLARMKPTTILVNTARGAVVDTPALVDALRNGDLLGAGLDVFEEESLPLSSPLFELANVTLTPHAGWYSEESYLELKRRAVENVADVCVGRRPRNILNPEVLALVAAP